jgi:DNA (cytosine-5)-methyltransferase 1
MPMPKRLSSSLKFIDLFAGCGGFSLGLVQAGLTGVFAVEKAADAFRTFESNFLLGPEEWRFHWPEWLPREALDINKFMKDEELRGRLARLRGSIDVIAGGPPCQGFSFAGRRNSRDPRNQLFRRYVEIVELLQPRAVIVENVPGMRVAHGIGDARTRREGRRQSFYDRLKRELERVGYFAEGEVHLASAFGVPQLRPRLFVIGLHKDVAGGRADAIKQFLLQLDKSRRALLRSSRLMNEVPAEEALSDLVTEGIELQDCVDPESPKGFKEIRYREPENKTPYQELMRRGMRAGEQMDSLRLARHTPEVRERIAFIIENYPKGVSLNDRARALLGLTKHRTCVMREDRPSPTLTTLPDDLFHYREPRILTVREMARLQSFPDRFTFRGKFTTGGDRRKLACPRYSQVGNAVPPLVARAIGMALRRFLAPAAA